MKNMYSECPENQIQVCHDNTMKERLGHDVMYGVLRRDGTMYRAIAVPYGGDIFDSAFGNLGHVDPGWLVIVANGKAHLFAEGSGEWPRNYIGECFGIKNKLDSQSYTDLLNQMLKGGNSNGSRGTVEPEHN